MVNGYILDKMPSQKMKIKPIKSLKLKTIFAWDYQTLYKLLRPLRMMQNAIIVLSQIQIKRDVYIAKCKMLENP